RRLWKYFQQDEHHRRQLGHLATATMAAGIGQPIPDPDIADVEPPSGFWASVTGSVNEVAEGGLWRDPGSNEIGGILAYTASCKATEVWIELNPHELVVSDSDSIA
ncbi:MAG: hypothetical protein HY976_00645, partial [Candidatus Kerfeldbacteria bacterium]|nr:hypothetical protein [Candidatus Kerfeldbacteria bacterium]